jgi:hypothetical protein
VDPLVPATDLANGDDPESTGGTRSGGLSFRPVARNLRVQTHCLEAPMSFVSIPGDGPHRSTLLPSTLANGRVLAALFLLAGLALFTGACASSGQSSSRGTSGAITFEMIDDLSSSVSDAYAVVDRLRPQWLRSRGATSLRNPQPDYPVVYLDGTRWGPVGTLREINSNSVSEIRYISAAQATTRFGIGHMAGAILVASR